MQITEDTTVDKLQRIAKKRFTSVDSENRRQYFEDLCALVTRENISLGFTDGGSRVIFGTDTGGQPRILISSEIPHSSFDTDLWSFLYQKSMCYHESAHVLYTDSETMKDRVEYWKGQGFADEFKRVHNIIEDIYIEAAISEVYDVREDFNTVNELLSERALQQYPFTMKIHHAIDAYLCSFFHDNGFIGKQGSEWKFEKVGDEHEFFDTVKPYIDNNLPPCLEVDDPEQRVHEISKFFSGLIPHYRVDDDTPERKGSAETGSGSAKEMEESPDIDLKPSADADPDDDGIEAELMELEASEEKESPDESMGKWKDAAGSSGSGLSVPEDPGRSEERDDWRASAENHSKTMERYLRNQLIMERKTEKRKKLRSGRLDSRSIPRAMRGNSNIFYRNRDPDEKDYSAAILLDQSGSMNEGETEAAVKASGACSFAFDAVGIDNCIVSIYTGESTLLKDFSEGPKNSLLFCNRSSGGTPLKQGLTMCRERLRQTGSHPFILVITDGEPAAEQAYLNEIRSTNMPVLGVYLSYDGLGYSGHAKNFHRLEVCQPNEVYDGLRRLISRSVI